MYLTFCSPVTTVFLLSTLYLYHTGFPYELAEKKEKKAFGGIIFPIFPIPITSYVKDHIENYRHREGGKSQV